MQLFVVKFCQPKLGMVNLQEETMDRSIKATTKRLALWHMALAFVVGVNVRRQKKGAW